MSVTLGHTMIGIAVIDLVVILWMVRKMRRANPDTPAWIIVGAAVLMTVGLCLVALFHPIGQMPIA